MWSNIVVILSHVKEWTTIYLVCLTMSCTTVIVNSFHPLLFGRLIDELTHSRGDILLWTFLIVFFSVVSAVVSYLQSKEYSKLSLKIENKLKKVALSKIVGIDCLRIETMIPGEIIQTVEEDVKVIANLFIQTATNIIMSFGSVFFIAILLIRINLIMTILLIITFPILMRIYSFAGKETKKISHEMKLLKDKYLTILSGIIPGMKTIHIFNSEKYFLNRLNENLSHILSRSMDRAIFTSRANLVAGLVNLMFSVMILIYGVNLILENKISIGDLVAFNTYSAVFMSALFKLTQINIEIQNGHISVQRYCSMINSLDFKSPTEINDGIHIEQDSQFGIVIEELFFKYNNRSTNTLSRVNEDILPQQLTAIVGPAQLVNKCRKICA